ncbi:MAG: MBL fold metallo-hydrolase, partial [Nitrospiraceae bacterium]
EETNRTLFCSDLFHHSGDVKATTSADVVGRFRDKLLKEQGSPFAHYIPWTTRTEQILRRLAALQPSTFAVMHGSSYTGDGETLVNELAVMLREIDAAQETTAAVG